MVWDTLIRLLLPFDGTLWNLCYLFVGFLVAWLGGVILLASTGKTLGVRKVYIKLLLYIFEKCRIKIEAHHKMKSNNGNIQQTAIIARTQATHSNMNVPSEDDIIEESLENNGTDDAQQQSENIIERSEVLTIEGKKMRRDRTMMRRRLSETGEEFNMSHVMEFCKLGIESIIEDEVTQRFDAEELPSWNLLTRTNQNYHYISFRLALVWWIGFLFRYFFLLPIRTVLVVFGISNMVLWTGLLGYIPDGPMKRWLYRRVMLMCFRILSRGFSAIITYHDRQNLATSQSICVANHTSPIDVIILACDNCYALIGQSHGGLLGLIQRSLSRAASHIWFERSETKDRMGVANRLREHAADADKLPILIFPEGTCINNTSVMQFKKGTFEIDTTIYPVAIKYDPRFGDAFWNSSRQSMIPYLIMMVTSWAIVCNVWYLPPMTRKSEETAIDFANRVKGEIARRGGLVDLEWDGQLKRQRAKSAWSEPFKKEYSKRLKAA